MRYIINDDDLEFWYSTLYQANKNLNDPGIEFVLDEMEKEIQEHVPKENLDKFLKLLRGNITP